MRRRWWRLAVAACLVLLAAFELDAAARLLREHTVLWRRFRQEVTARQSAIAEVTRRGDAAAAREVAALLPSGAFAEVELFDTAGRPLHAHPAPAPIQDWPRPEELTRVLGGFALSRVVAGPSPRILTYLAVPWLEGRVILRVASAVGDPILEPRQRLPLIRHAAVLLLLIALAILVLVPSGDPASAAGSGALRAYEEAMGRLQAQGQAQSRRHELERRRLRSELDDKDAMARAGELTSGIVHEVRNGLATIVGYARLLERSADAAAADSARRIREECDTLETVVRRFVEFVKTEDLQLAGFDVVRMLSRVAGREGRARAGGIVEMPPSLPPTALVGDEEMLERAFENLVRNARAAAGDGGHVWIEVARDAETVTVVIADDGPGMTAGQRATIRPFAESKGGLGLGLATALKIVRLHRGEIVLEERRPRGLRAVVRLPAAGPGEAVAATP